MVATRNHLHISDRHIDKSITPDEKFSQEDEFSRDNKSDVLEHVSKVDVVQA
jgi:hypothetical protein